MSAGGRDSGPRTIVAGETQPAKSFVAAVEAIYDAAPDPSRWPAALQAMADVFDDFGALLVFGRDDGTFGHIVSPSLQIAFQDYLESGLAGQDLRAQRGVETGFYIGRDAVTDRDLVTDAEMDTHPFYRFLARHQLKYFVAAPVSPDPRVAVSIAVQRAICKQPYVPSDLDVMEKLCRHAEKSLRLSIRLLDAELSNLGLRESLSRLGIGVFALDSLARVVFSNSAGERLLGHGLNLIDGCLTMPRSASRGHFEQALRVALRGRPADLVLDARPILIDRPDAMRPLTIYVLPVTSPDSLKDAFLTHVRALVLAIDPEVQSPPDPAVVRDVLGLTLGEARVAALVGSGLAPREAAAKLGIAEETARTALKRVFSKVGVSRQSELAALLTKLVLR
jgi:DNA-binding CsgD family transcriptional regulator